MTEEEKIKQLLNELLERMGFKFSLDVQETTENLQFIIRTDEAGLLIGDEGQNLIALNHIAKRLIEKMVGPTRLPFALDINDYQKQKADEIKDLAHMSAKRVRFFKKEVELRPMTSYERRIVHAALTEYPDIKTESKGEGPTRRVVIKPF